MKTIKTLIKIQGLIVGSIWTMVLIDIFGMVGEVLPPRAEEVWTLSNSFSELAFVLFVALWTYLTLDYFKAPNYD